MAAHVTVPFVSVLMAVEGYLKGLILQDNVTSRNANAKASCVSEFSHTVYHIVSRSVVPRLQLLFYILLQEPLIIQLIAR